MLVYTRDKSEYARFDAIQTLVAHIFTLALLALVMVAYFVLFFGSFATAVAAPHAHAAPPLMFFAIFPLVFLFVIGSLIGSFTTTLLGIRRAMDLKDLTMPIIGKWVFARFFRGRRVEAAV